MSTAQTDFAALVARFHQHRSHDPDERLHLGLSEGLGALSDPSLAAGAAHAAEAEGLLADFRALSREGLDFDQRLDVELAELALAQEIEEEGRRFNGRSRREQLPRAAALVGDGLFQLFINDPRPAHDRLADILARLQQAPAALSAMLERLDTPVARWAAIDIQRVEGLPSLFETLRGWSESTGFADHGALVRAAEATEQALGRYLEGLRALPTTTQLHLGAEQAARLVSLRGIEPDLDQIHGFAVDFLARTGAQIEELRTQLVQRYDLAADTPTPVLQDVLNKRFRVPLPEGRLEALLDRFQVERARILSFIRERDLFPILDDQDMRILRTPVFMEPSIPAGAMMSPPPFRSGTRTSLVYLTLSEELLDEHTELSIPNMMIHEGIPGHHLQLATAAAHSSVVRRHFDALEHAEGWTTMLEDYLLDLDYMGDLTDEARFIAKRDISRIGARVAIDLFFMTGERRYLDVGVPCDISSADPFVAAGSLLQAVTGFVPGRVQAELNWYSQERGYPLSYLTGNQLVWALKRDLIAAQNARPDGLSGLDLDRAFHRIYLQSGNMPVSFLRRVCVHEGLLPG